MDPLGIARGTLRLALGLAVQTLDTVAGALRVAHDLLEEPAERARDASDAAAEPAAEEERRNGAAAAVEVEVRRAPPEPEPPPEAEPVHVDTGVETVAEVAEPGAEDGAHAELSVEEPWEGYRRMNATEVQRALADAGPEALAAVRLYESTHRRRRSVLNAVDRRLRD